MMAVKAALTVSQSENTVPRTTALSPRVMNPAPLSPSLDQDLHFFLCVFGRSGLGYVETDPAEADATTIVRALLRGLYDRPLRVMAVNAEDAEHEGCDLTAGTLDFIEIHAERVS